MRSSAESQNRESISLGVPVASPSAANLGDETCSSSEPGHVIPNSEYLEHLIQLYPAMEYTSVPNLL